MPSMIFHAPYPLQCRGSAASAIRPVKMRQAFSDLGYSVFEITGHAAQRLARLKQLQARLEAGERFDFMYSENATIPPAVTDPHHFPPHFFLEAKVFRTCASYGIPTGVFYRDIYWVFPEYDSRVRQPLNAIMKALYRWELSVYDRYASVIFLPTLKMVSYLPVLNGPNLIPLPPGGDKSSFNNEERSEDPHRPLHVFYIGGIGGHYRLFNLVEAASDLSGVELTICTNAKPWEDMRPQYPLVESSNNIQVVHASGDERDQWYRWADVCYVALEPQPYGVFAAPVKFYEYINRGKPMIVTKGTHIAEVVRGQRLGWVTDNSVAQLRDLLCQLRDDREQVRAARELTVDFSREQTWMHRAQEVQHALVKE